MATQTRTSTPPPNGSSSAGRFGTFAGVFTPNVLTILGIILFLRIGWVVGQAGMWGALIIVAIANMISLLTGLSLSAIATSMEVKAGGNYYLISRSLGLEIGGAIGIPLFLSQAISVAFYIIGFTEALLSIAFFQTIDPRLIATGVALLFGIISYVGADFALKIQFFILAILVASLVSFFTGGWNSFTEPILTTNYTAGVSFWVAFAVFFPAVTGIEVGTSLSGDLKNPSRSIPVGTISSIVVTAIIYFFVVVWFAYHGTAEQLIGDNLAMQRIASIPFLILLGVWASTLSSALGSIIAAPRTLQAIAKDRVVPFWIANQMGSATEPRVAVILTSIIAIAVIWMGDLNFVAPIIAMFFLNTYGMVNVAAATEKLVGNPSYRPRFRIPWFVSAAGAIGCYGAMFLINVPATLAAIIISYGIYFYLQSRRLERTWGDVQSGVWLAVARLAILNLESQRRHTKNWRPNLMVFTGQPHNREQLVEVARWISLGQGIVTFFQLLIGDVGELAGKGRRRAARRLIRSYIQNHQMTAVAEAEIVPNFREGVLVVAQAHGMGGLEANSVLFGWSHQPEGRAMQLSMMRDLVALEKTVLFLHFDQGRGFGNRKVINVWWRGQDSNADMMLLLAHLIQQHRTWKDAQIRLQLIIDNEEGVAPLQAHMEALCAQVRVQAVPVVIVREDETVTYSDMIVEASGEADLSLLGIKLPEADDVESYAENFDKLVQRIGTVLLVRNSQADEDLLSTG
ncbi:MAG: amino acid permease [Chloroflexota bacterium]